MAIISSSTEDLIDETETRNKTSKKRVKISDSSIKSASGSGQSNSYNEVDHFVSGRNSFHELKKRFKDEEQNFDNLHDTHWRFSQVKKTFKNLQLTHLFRKYTQRLNETFFALFFLVQGILFLMHFILVVVFSRNNLMDCLVEIVLYGVYGISSLIAYGLAEFRIKNRRPSLLVILSFVVYGLINFLNIFIPIYYYFISEHSANLRPKYTPVIILACYVYFCFPHTLMCIATGLGASSLHVLVIIFMTYANNADDNNSVLWRRVLSEVTYLLCINGLGGYYRFMNDNIKRKSFLDRRACVISNRQLKYEKEQEELLMNNIIPIYVIEDVKRDISQSFNESGKTILGSLKPRKREFASYDNVSILFADIVNYTEMTSKLKITDLLETLNSLFGKFDDASVELKVLRIKFLGDCYYCVAGLPLNPVHNHAEACVDLGLEMIKIISRIRRKRNLNINMRIGVHSGTIFCGIIGHQKWQFDIWSKDADLANKMETEGTKGMVHITKQTKDILKKTYNLIPTDKGETVPLFKQRNIQTFLIAAETKKTNSMSLPLSKKPQVNYFHLLSIDEDEDDDNNYPALTSQELSRPSKFQKRKLQFNDTNSISKIEQKKNSILPVYESRLSSDSLDNNSPSLSTTSIKYKQERRVTDGKRRTAFMNRNIKLYEDHLKETHSEMEEVIEKLSLSKYQQWFKFHEINPITLFFGKLKLEKNFFKMPDPLFKYYLLSEACLVVFLIVVQNLAFSRSSWNNYWVSYGTLAIIIVIFIPITWTDYWWSKYAPEKYLENQCVIIEFLCHASKTVTKSISARLGIYTVVCGLFTTSVFLELNNCADTDGLNVNTSNCLIPGHMTQTCAFAIIMNFLFLRLSVWFKLLYASTITLVYAYCVFGLDGVEYEEIGESSNLYVPPKVSQIMTIIFLTVVLHAIDRQSEYMNRLDFLWSENLREEQAKVTNSYLINKMLLNNILPEHVADMYLDVSRPPTDFYHESYANVAVMFASVVGYEVDHIDEKTLLVLMNEIICDFDKIKMEENLIEKIKVAKWTYMAACGISPGLGEDEDRNPAQYVLTLLKFAGAIMKQLAKLNSEHLQDFKLRIGISNGGIMAGVVGSKKPLYDIWGDPVNMAARMDTTGEANKIQVLEHTARVIQSAGIQCTYRGKILVKGKDQPMDTYFIDLDNNFDFKMV